MLIVGSILIGWYGLIAAKTYLQLEPNTELVMIEAGKTVGGVWSKERLYPNLYAQITHSLFEYSHMPMKAEGLTTDGYISGTTIHGYLSDFAEKFGLTKRVWFNTRVESVDQTESGEWLLSLRDLASDPETKLETMRCAKLIVANGPTSNPYIPNFPQDNFTTPIIHSRDLGKNLSALEKVDRVLIVGGAKSSFDAVYLMMLQGKKVDWIIRPDGSGPLSIYPAKLAMFNSMGVACSRFLSKFSPSILSTSDLWYTILHSTAAGAAATHGFWRGLTEFSNWYAGYGKSENAEKLRPTPDR